MSIDDGSGYKHIPKQYDAKRYQHRLFAEIRTAPAYTSTVSRLREAWERDGRPGERSSNFTDTEYWVEQPLDRSSAYFHALEHAAGRLRLTFNDKPARWATSFLHDDVLGRFDPELAPPMVSIAHQRLIEISISPALATVDTYSGWNPRTDEVRTLQARHERPMMVGESEWRELERMAVEAARQVVADLRSRYGESRGSSLHAMQRRKLGYESRRTIQIHRLALRIMNRAGTRNTARIDRDWCEALGIDVPANKHVT